MRDKFTVTLRVGISHIRGDAKVKMTLSEADTRVHAVYHGKGDVVGGTATLRAGFESGGSRRGNESDLEGEAQIVGRVWRRWREACSSRWRRRMYRN